MRDYISVHLYKPMRGNDGGSVIIKLSGSSIIMCDLRELYALLTPGTTMYVWDPNSPITDNHITWIVTKPVPEDKP